jgi:type I restriction enzyme S subunit
MSMRSGQPGINGNEYSQLPISLPPLCEQRAIATALSDVDALLEGLDRLIAKKRDLKQAAMQQLLTGQTRLPGFEGEWEEKQLGELGYFLKGSGVRRDEAQSGSLPCIRYGEIYTVHHDVVREFHSWISMDVAKMAVQIQKGDLLFAGSGETKDEIGKCVAVVTDKEAYAGGDIVILRAPTTDPVFMGYALNHPAVNLQKSRFGQGDAVVHISASALSQIVITLPEETEQRPIATVLADMDGEIETLKKRRAKTAALKQAMMQELLTGRTRLL